MKTHNIYMLTFLVGLLSLTACKKEITNSESDSPNYTSIQPIPDSIEVGEIVIYNAFKHQILAGQSEVYDRQLIMNDVYHRHQVLWDSCLGMIFGEQNALKFQTDEGMADWNESLFSESDPLIDSLTTVILEYAVDSIFNYHTIRFDELGYETPKARISLAFVPFQGIGFGGCANDQFILELNNPEFELIYTLEKGIPHELYHFINESLLGQQEEFTALDLAINEGLACRFTEMYFNGDISKYEAVENMTQEDWQYYEAREKEIFQTMQPYFSDTSGDNGLLHPERYDLFLDAPRSVYYWLGYQIVETYLEKYPETSMEQLASIPYYEIYMKSAYADQFK
ncbi:MAG: DUF2268 domain-containing putative Zn-dependent protease [Bacteroidota bacterium]